LAGVNEATPATIPFLWQLVMMLEVQIKAEILEMFLKLSRWSQQSDAAAAPGRTANPYLEWGSRTRDAIRQGLAATTLLGTSVDPDVALAHQNLTDEFRGEQ
jgi:hypothetical protein